MTRTSRLALAAMFGLWAAASSVHAARPARVDVQDAEMYEGPGKGFRLLEKLSKGTPVGVSNVATEGYFKVRTPSGTVGWIAADALVISEGGGNSDPTPMTAPPTGPPTSSGSASAPVASAFDNRPGKRILRFRLHGGYAFFAAGDINAQINSSDAIRNGYYYGGEINFLLPSDLAMVVRVENVLHGSVGKDSKTGTVYQWNLSSWPAMIGLEMQAARDTHFSSQFAVMGGLALGTKFTSVANLPEPNETAIERYGFAALARITLNWHFTKMFFAQVEGGYRYLSTQKDTPAVAGDGSSILKDSSGNFVPLGIDMSGPMVSVGVGFVL